MKKIASLVCVVLIIVGAFVGGYAYGIRSTLAESEGLQQLQKPAVHEDAEANVEAPDTPLRWEEGGSPPPPPTKRPMPDENWSYQFGDDDCYVSWKLNRERDAIWGVGAGSRGSNWVYATFSRTGELR